MTVHNTPGASRPFGTYGSPEDLQARNSIGGTATRSLRSEILDEKPGLAEGQPTICLADSPFILRTIALDESDSPASRDIARPHTQLQPTYMKASSRKE